MKAKQAREGVEQPVSWKDKCIREFKLKAVPASWAEDVAIPREEEAWKNYYNFRKRYDSDDTSEMGDTDVIERWTTKMENLKEEVLGEEPEWEWAYTFLTGEVYYQAFSFTGEIESAYLYSFVWSPYAIPRGLHLLHRYHSRALQSTVEYNCNWGVELMDFSTSANPDKDKHSQICSICFEDERLRAFVIRRERLNSVLVNVLRRFLFGSASPESKTETCSDYDFLLLLFGSMATFDFQTMCGDIGWHWSPAGCRSEKELQPLVDEGLIRPGKDGQVDAYGIRTSWLEYYIRDISGTKRPIDKFYRDPTIEDALGNTMAPFRELASRVFQNL